MPCFCTEFWRRKTAFLRRSSSRGLGCVESPAAVEPVADRFDTDPPLSSTSDTPRLASGGGCSLEPLPPPPEPRRRFASCSPRTVSSRNWFRFASISPHLQRCRSLAHLQKVIYRVAQKKSKPTPNDRLSTFGAGPFQSPVWPRVSLPDRLCDPTGTVTMTTERCTNTRA